VPIIRIIRCGDWALTGMVSSRNTSIWPSESSMPVVCPIQPMFPSISVADETSSERMSNSFLDNSISADDYFRKWEERYLPVHTPSEATTEVMYGNTSASNQNFIPIGNTYVELLNATSGPRTLGLPSLGSQGAIPCLPSICPAAEHRKRSERRMSKPPKSYDCVVCSESFTRPSSLRTHENTHTGQQAFGCNFKGCAKKFGSISP